jgi:hypothetical protein
MNMHGCSIEQMTGVFPPGEAPEIHFSSIGQSPPLDIVLQEVQKLRHGGEQEHSAGIHITPHPFCTMTGSLPENELHNQIHIRAQIWNRH